MLDPRHNSPPLNFNGALDVRVTASDGLGLHADGCDNTEAELDRYERRAFDRLLMRLRKHAPPSLIREATREAVLDRDARFASRLIDPDDQAET